MGLETMGLMYNLLPDFVSNDQRGKLVQIVREGYCQVNYIESVSGAIRGYHYHKYNCEIFYITKGKIEVAVWKVDEEGIAYTETFETRNYKRNDFFKIDPYTAHVFTYHEDSALISMYNKGVELPDGRMDIFKVSEKEYLRMEKGE
jgi:dTDP-4-dehydrorhamnose 3,5-epimerase-like enzyme